MLNFFKKLFRNKKDEAISVATLDNLHVFVNNIELEYVVSIDVLYNSNLKANEVVLKKLGFPIDMDTSNYIQLIIIYNEEQTILDCKVKLDQMNFGSENDGILTTDIRFKVKEITN